jgi:putative ABC transport system permease protein
MLTALRETVARLRASFTGGALDRDFADEMQSHLAMLVDDNLRRGMTPAEARRAALIRIGGLASIADQHRDVRGFPLIDSIAQDIRFAFRLLAKERWFSAAAIAALALGIGVNAVGFTIANAALLRGLPFEDSGRLYMLSWQTRSGSRSGLSYAELQDWRRQNRAFEGIAAFASDRMTISDDDGSPEEVRGAALTANAFAVLHQPPVLGRDFVADDERKGAEPVILIGHSLWRRRFNSDPNVLGKPLRVNGRAAAIVGVMPESMRFPNNNELWLPFVPTAEQERRDVRALAVFGRLKRDADQRTARAELDTVAQQLAVAYPDTNKNLVGARVETFTQRFVGGPARTVFVTTMAAVTLVLLISCANVANLLLSRSTRRAREIAVRMALGATAQRIVRQLLLESLVLSAIGGTIGLLLATAGVRVLEAAVPDPDRPYWIVFEPDVVVFGYVAAVCIVTAIVFGLAPALQMSKPTHNDALKESARGTFGTRRARLLSSGIVVAELALSVVLLIAAGLMVRSFIKLYTLDLGFSTEHLLVMDMQLPTSKYRSADSRRAFFQRLEDRLLTLPAIEAVALTTDVPPDSNSSRLLQIEGATARPDEPLPSVTTVTVSPSFFSALGVPMLRGRVFDGRDGMPGSEATLIINERLAAQFFAGTDPIGRRVRLARREAVAATVAEWRTVVGVTPSIRQGSREDAYLNPVAYVPYRETAPPAVSLLVRSALPAATVMDAVRKEVRAIDRDQPVFAIQTFDQVLDMHRWPYRVFGGLFVIFALVALVLSSVGLYAVMAYSVVQRTQEIGVRMALGAQARQVSALFLRRGLVQLGIGLTLGLSGALAASRVLRNVLVDIAPDDPVTFGAITLLLTIVSIAACLVPARQAARIDPLNALRAE